MTQTDYFSTDFQTSRDRFRAWMDIIKAHWPEAQLFSHTIQSDGDLTIDWIEAPAQHPHTLLVLTAGEHGIEAFVGGAVQQMLVTEYLSKIDPQKVSLALVHAINPWGMASLRRTNKANVDLNRNFVSDPLRLDPASNADYARLNSFINPKGRILPSQLSKALFYPALLANTLLLGSSRIRSATLLGQYAFPQGIYYGGRGIQPETELLMGLYRRWFEMYEQVLHIDLHTGYGPRYQMSVVNSSFEETASQEFIHRFNYPLVVKSDPDEFYGISGDMIDYVYQMARSQFPGKPFYSTTFEFGTVGDSLPASLWALRTMIFENQAYHHGASDPAQLKSIQGDFVNLYNPPDSAWREVALANARQALNGILNAWQVLKS